jgi:hypothetical protein
MFTGSRRRGGWGHRMTGSCDGVVDGGGEAVWWCCRLGRVVWRLSRWPAGGAVAVRIRKGEGGPLVDGSARAPVKLYVAATEWLDVLWFWDLRLGIRLWEFFGRMADAEVVCITSNIYMCAYTSLLSQGLDLTRLLGGAKQHDMTLLSRPLMTGLIKCLCGLFHILLTYTVACSYVALQPPSRRGGRRIWCRSVLTYSSQIIHFPFLLIVLIPCTK